MSIRDEYNKLVKKQATIKQEADNKLHSVNEELQALRERCPHEIRVSVGGGESVCQDCGILID